MNNIIYYLQQSDGWDNNLVGALATFIVFILLLWVISEGIKKE